MRRPDADGAVPTARAECVLGYEIPVDTEDLAIMFFPVLDWEVFQIAVEELNAAIAGGCEDLILVDFGPGEIV
jgi:hypothetical protein